MLSLYIPKNKKISDVIIFLKREKAEAKNIKSDQTRHAVEQNLESCIQRLKYHKSGGVALFAGNDHLYEMKIDTSWYYRCSKCFYTERIGTILDTSIETLGVISMDLEQCSFGLLAGNAPVVLETITSGIPSKHRKGGQSAKRFNHLRKEAKHEWFVRCLITLVTTFWIAKELEDSTSTENPSPKENSSNEDT